MHGSVIESAPRPQVGAGTNNYFRVGTESFFFNEKDESSIEEAFKEACDQQRRATTIDPDTHVKKGPRLSVWTKPRLFGDWSDVDPIHTPSVRRG